MHGVQIVKRVSPSVILAESVIPPTIPNQKIMNPRSYGGNKSSACFINVLLSFVLH